MELKVDNKKINYMKVEDEDYISITDMLKSKDDIFINKSEDTLLIESLIQKIFNLL